MVDAVNGSLQTPVTEARQEPPREREQSVEETRANRASERVQENQEAEQTRPEQQRDADSRVGTRIDTEA